MAIEQQARDWKSIDVNSLTTKRTANSYPVAGTSNSIASNTVTDDINGKKVHFAVSIDTAFAAVTAPVTVEASMDNATWKMIVKLTSDINPETVGTSLYTFDASDFNGVPYIRLHFNGGLGETPGTINSTGIVSFAYHISTT